MLTVVPIVFVLCPRQTLRYDGNMARLGLEPR